MKANNMLADLTECVAIFDTLCTRLDDMAATERLLMQLALRETARYAASFCAMAKRLDRDGLVAALELIDVTVSDDDMTDDCRPEELN